MSFLKGLYSHRSWGQQFLLFLMIWLLFYFVFNLVGGFMMFLLTDAQSISDLENLTQAADNPTALKYFQMVLSIGIFVLPPLVFALLATDDPLAFLRIRQWPAAPLLVLGILIVFTASPVMYALLDLNQSIPFPESLSWLEEMLRSMEERTNSLLEQMLAMDTIGALLLNLTVIAVIPALGEELLFRGGIQQLLHKWTGKPHLAIILGGAIFSFIHFQFFGFMPRMLLGILFGYLFYWSGNLWLPILAHFVHNATQVVMVYLYDSDVMETNIEEVESVPLIMVLPSVLFLTILLILFYKLATNAKESA